MISTHNIRTNGRAHWQTDGAVAGGIDIAWLEFCLLACSVRSFRNVVVRSSCVSIAYNILKNTIQANKGARKQRLAVIFVSQRFSI